MLRHYVGFYGYGVDGEDYTFFVGLGGGGGVGEEEEMAASSGKRAFSLRM
jgi:hypothetical protein